VGKFFLVEKLEAEETRRQWRYWQPSTFKM